ncbi:MAG TPA: glycosyltransferase [Dehalococcoidia bacterium]|nr:glycosyltransferase [Dehalococcoidia bacterium]
MTPALPVSVVLATYKRDELLRRCLLALLDQETPFDYEIVVVDDACSATTPGVVEEALAQRGGCGIEVRLLQGRSRGPATARNIGWRAARGSIIAFTDDDAYPADRFWLSQGYRWFEDGDVNAVGGAVLVPSDHPPTDFQRNVKELERGEFLTCNAFYRRSALESVGGFDERFTAPFREDSDLQYRVEALGGRMITDPRLLVVHPAPRGRFGVSLRLQRNSVFNALMYKKHPERYRARLQKHPPYGYYAILASGSLALASVAAGKGPAALVFGLVWGGLESRFFLRRVRGASHSLRHIVDMALTSLLIPPLSVYWRLRGAIRYRVPFI